MSSFSVEKIGLQDSQQFSKLFIDYLAQQEQVQSLYNFYPDLAGLDAAIAKRSTQPINRQVLVERLQAQYKGLPVSSTVQKNIDLLSGTNTFTITTGHQLCLGTGPLYLILKTLSCVKLCETLKAKHADKEFVPVFWMASEDHDAAEINHFYVFGKKYTWETTQTGAVGRFITTGIEEVLDTIKDIPVWLKEAYQSSATLAEATRKVMHHLFAEYGVVVIDGDDAALKKEFSGIIEKELFNQSAVGVMNQTNKAIEGFGYATQVHPRDINLFYIKDAIRERLEKQGERFVVLHTELSFSAEEIKKELAEHPERFSPNVVLRPLYESTILPDIAYVGGPGEIAYWLQLKEVFAVYNTFLPAIFPRMFSGVVTKQQCVKLEKANVSIAELFLNEFDLKQLIVSRSVQEEISIEAHAKEIITAFDKIAEIATTVDGSLQSWAQAEKAKALKQIDDIEKKIRKAEERKHEDAIKSVLGIREKILPNGKLQERQESVFTFLVNDADLIQKLYQSLDPCTFNIQMCCYE
ncbi:bacillithiol biosynthesis cysteine-adding enzyme BshC [Cytophaga aurantiaca]|uniref:bacillithiol biosynthesis cysteine-adding enzyme BshC n=1 Tax=Cytophaga aurantiaca TaxID=29530 RepID=UPI0003647234|nr:bacillithiol biosynthesis cysteine-adding enzyme BshC [Cytophaga aurantiaca]